MPKSRASASEEMSAQAEQMKAMVCDLVALVGGSTNNHRNVSDAEVKAPSTLSRTDLAGSAKKEQELHRATDETPEQIIPLGDAEFKDF